MQSNKKVQSQTEQDVDLTPMLDVIFIMLIFFIVTASFVKENGLALNKPPISKEKSGHRPIVVEVMQNGDIQIQHRPVDARSVGATVTRLLAENPQAKVAVKLHKRAKTASVAKTIDALHGVNVTYPPISLVEI